MKNYTPKHFQNIPVKYGPWIFHFTKYIYHKEIQYFQGIKGYDYPIDLYNDNITIIFQMLKTKTSLIAKENRNKILHSYDYNIQEST